MIERLEPRARRAVVIAQELAVAEGATAIGPEHVYAGILADALHRPQDEPVDRILEALEVPVRPAWLVALALRGRRQVGPLTERDADGLAALGVDLDTLVGFPSSGPAPVRPVPQQRRAWWRRPEPAPAALPEEPASPHHRPFTATAKRALELTLREALALGHPTLGADHLLLGLARVGDPGVDRAMALVGIDLNLLRAAVQAARAGGTAGP
ncbi:MAG: Clp protease N-terminal domain-containing protein [Marmoricola sp.]